MIALKKHLNTKVTKEHEGEAFYSLTFVYFVFEISFQ